MWAKNKKWVMGWTRGVIHYHLVTILDGMPNAIGYSSFHFTQSLSDALNKTAHTSPLHIFYVKPPNHILNLFPSCSFSFARFALDRIQCSPPPLLGFVPKLSEKQPFRLFELDTSFVKHLFRRLAVLLSISQFAFDEKQTVRYVSLQLAIL